MLTARTITLILSVMRNVTIALDEKVAAFTKVYAARQSKSVSAFLGDYLKGLMEQETSRKMALEDYLSRKTFFKSSGKRFDREELYDRAVFR